MWEYNFDLNKNIEFLECQIGDMTGDGRNELVVILYSYEQKQQIYLFKIDQNIPRPNPEIYSITSLHNSSEPIQTKQFGSDRKRDIIMD